MTDTRPLWKHQLECLENAKDLPNYALFHEMGVGKTRTVIELLRYKYNVHGKLLRTLIVAPQVVLENWKREIVMFSQIKKENIVVLQGTGKARAGQVQGCLEKDCIIIVNYEGLLIDDVFDLLVQWKPEIVVADESHRIKSPESKRTKAMVFLGDMARYRYCLTGTPILNSILDVFSQFRFLDGGQIFGKNFFMFRNQYCYNANANKPAHVTWPDWKVRPNAESIIGDQMSKISMHVKKSECLDLPPFVRTSIFVELSPDQKKHYDEMKKHFITMVEGQACTAQLAVTKSLRLQQLVSGFSVVEDIQGERKEIKLKSNPRLDALKDLLTDLTPANKVIVWACFRENYEQIRQVCQELKIEYVELHGEISTSDRQEAMDLFNSSPRIRVLIGNQGAGGIGVSLIAASYSIYYSRNFSLEHDLQSEARNFRGGSEIHDKITRIDLVAKSTIDEKVLLALSNKQAISDKVLIEMIKEEVSSGSNGSRPTVYKSVRATGKDRQEKAGAVSPSGRS